MRLLYCLLLWVSFVYAIDPNAGTAGYQFLKINLSPRSVALGEISSGIFGYANDVSVNTSAMAFEKDKTIFGSVGILYANITGGSIGGFLPLKDNKRIGIFADFIDYGDMDRTDENGKLIGKFSAQSLRFGVGFAETFVKDLAFGGRVNLIYEGIAENNSYGLSTDISSTLKLLRGRASLGLALKNMGFQLKGFTEEHKDKLPLVVAFGGNIELRGLPLRIFAEISKGIDEPLRFSFGGEFFELKPLYIRVGYTTREKSSIPAFKDDENLNGFSCGFGLNMKKEGIGFDYAISSFGPLGTTHKFGLSYNGF